jgi:two pore calcium channel protein 3
MLLNLYLFGNMTLAAVSSSFKDNLKNELKKTLRVKRKKLESAFNIIKTRVSKNGVSIPIIAISYENFYKLLKTIDPLRSDFKIKVIFQVLDFADDDCLRKC